MYEIFLDDEHGKEKEEMWKVFSVATGVMDSHI